MEYVSKINIFCFYHKIANSVIKITSFAHGWISIIFFCDVGNIIMRHKFHPDSFFWVRKVKVSLEQREVAFLYWNSNFRKFCWVIRTQPISVLKLFLLYPAKMEYGVNFWLTVSFIIPTYNTKLFFKSLHAQKRTFVLMNL